MTTVVAFWEAFSKSAVSKLSGPQLPSRSPMTAIQAALLDSSGRLAVAGIVEALIPTDELPSKALRYGGPPRLATLSMIRPAIRARSSSLVIAALPACRVVWQRLPFAVARLPCSFQERLRQRKVR